jgi:hypothetical protein
MSRDNQTTIAISLEDKAMLSTLGELMGIRGRSSATSGLAFLVRHFHQSAVDKLSGGVVASAPRVNEVEVPQSQIPANRPTLGGQGYFS